MKLFKTIVMAAALVGLAAACNTFDGPGMKEEKPNFVINISSGLATKALTDDLAGERVIKDAQIFIFKNSDKSLYRYIDTTLTAAVQGNSVRLEENLNANESYYVSVLVNGFASIQQHKEQGQVVFRDVRNLTELRDKVTRLAGATPAGSGHFMMYGETDGQTAVGTTTSSGPVSVAVNQTATCNVVVTRFVSRIRLMSVENKLPQAYGTLRVEEVFIINAYSKWMVDGRDNSSFNDALAGRFNWGGQAFGQESSTDEAAIISSASECVQSEDNFTYQYGAHTYLALGTEEIQNFWERKNNGSQTPDADATKVYARTGDDPGTGLPFYVFANPTANDKGSQTSFKGRIGREVNAPTRLVVRATFANINETSGRSSYYYPVTIASEPNSTNSWVMGRNKSYDVSLVISGFGSKHPNAEPEKGSMQVNVSVKNWDEGAAWSVEY